jgi:predicted nucleotide-binding protein
MDKDKAIELLKQALTEIPHLRELHYDNREFELWLNRVRDVIRAALDSNDNNRFSSWRSTHIRGMFSEGVYRQDYTKQLEDYETALKSIIQKYEILGIESDNPVIEVAPESVFSEVPPQAFVSHGKESAALRKLKEFIETLGIKPLIVIKQASLDKTVDDKVNHYLGQADFVIILATGDDVIENKLHPRQNVIHEIGLAQKTHPGRIIYLLEEGAEFPSNVSPKVWESFKQRNMMDAFLGIVRELRAYGILKVIKCPI